MQHLFYRLVTNHALIYPSDAFNGTKHFVESAIELFRFSALLQSYSAHSMLIVIIIEWMHVCYTLFSIYHKLHAILVSTHTNSLMKSWIQQKWFLVHLQNAYLAITLYCTKCINFQCHLKCTTVDFQLHCLLSAILPWWMIAEYWIFSVDSIIIIEKWIYITCIYRIIMNTTICCSNSAVNICIVLQIGK